MADGKEYVDVIEVYYYSSGDESGELHVTYFETEKEYIAFREAFGSSLEIFSETPRFTTRDMLLEAMERGISLLKLKLEKRSLLVAGAV